MSLRIERIVSGGQTGADRAALDFAIEHGLPQTASERAFDMFLKVRHVQSLNGGGGVVFATGIPDCKGRGARREWTPSERGLI